MGEGRVTLDALAGPIRRRAFDAMDRMPPHVSAAVGTLLAHFDGPIPGAVVGSYGLAERAPTVRRIFGPRTSTVTSQFARAGYASPKAMLDALRIAMAICLLREGWTGTATAYQLGYGSPQSFQRTVRRLTGRRVSELATLAWEPILDAALRGPQHALALGAEGAA